MRHRNKPAFLRSPLIILAIFLGGLMLSSVYALPDTQVITNTDKGLWDNSTLISLKEDLTIGLETGTESQMFGYIRALALDAQDNIYVADSYELNISVYNSKGEFIREFGREGQGPGEFQTIGGMCWCPKDSCLYVTDRTNHRITCFSPEGKVVRIIKDDLFRAWIEDIACLDDGHFVLLARVPEKKGTSYKIMVTDSSFQKVFAEAVVEFPSHTVGLEWAPCPSDVGVIQGERVYYTSPSAYEIVLLDYNLNQSLIVKKSHPRMFIPQYVQGFYADFNTVETLLALDALFVVGVQSTPVKKIPRFKTKRELIEFTHTPDLREWNLEKSYQLDFFNPDFKFLGRIEIPANRRLAGKDSQGRLYFIEQEPYPCIVCCKTEKLAD